MDTLKNLVTIMNIQGRIGDILTANERNWVQRVLTDDPGLFAGFSDPDNTAIAKCMWHGEFPGKLLTGIAQTYLLHRDPDTLKVGNSFVEKFKEVQRSDGYLGPWTEQQKFEHDVSRDNLGKWDTWGQYHCIYGLYRWFQVTGNQDALHIAIRALDNIYDHFIAGNVSIAAQNWAECNLAIGHAFALLHEQTGDSRYLEAAERIVDRDWNDTYSDFYSHTVLSCRWMRAALEGKAYYESGQPRWEGLYALETLAVLYRITGKEEYRAALDQLWYGMYENDRHNTGSFGTGEGASGNLYGAGSETCNTVAWMAFSTEYLKICRNPLVADELELSFFNATLGSLLDGERNFTYMNDSDGTREAARMVLEGHSYLGARDMSCCQANGNRGLTQVTEWALLSEGSALYLNLFGACEMVTYLENGHRVTVREDTLYPKDGRIRIHVLTDCEDPLTLYIRIPSWSEHSELKMNGEQVRVRAGSYCAMKRVWHPDDTVELSLDMTPHFWVSGQEAPSQKVSVYTGPVLLAFRVSDELHAHVGFDISALRAMTAVDGDGIVNFEVMTHTGEKAILTDYYTAGKNGDNFVSWLPCMSGVQPLPSDRNGIPIWCNR